MILALLLACARDNDQAVDPEAAAILAVKEQTAAALSDLAAAAQDLQAVAPAGTWAPADADGLKAPWQEARRSYERVEGAIAVLFPALDRSLDERYDGFLAEAPDPNLFDDDGVIGVHAVERIVWADQHPAAVIAFESALPGYTPAAFPADDAQAAAFREALCQRLVDDTVQMQADFAPLALDAPAAFRGVIASMAEQYEKINLAHSGEDESRYAGHTLADMRANLDGGRATYRAFAPWLQAEGGDDLHAEIQDAFDRIDEAYAAIPGDAVPAVPLTWDPANPTAADLATPYGQLWTLLAEEADPTLAGSLVERLGAAADRLGIPQLPQ